MAKIPKVTQGSILIAQPFMDDTFFKRSVVGITENRTDGTVGFILNKPVKPKLNELIPKIKSEEEFKVFYGGPVATDTIHYIHSKGELLEESTQITKGIYWGGNFERLLFLIESGLINSQDIRFYLGYSGWSEGQLDTELETGSWVVSDWYANYAFSKNTEKLWKETLNHKGDPYSVIANIPPNSSNN